MYVDQAVLIINSSNKQTSWSWYNRPSD